VRDGTALRGVADGVGAGAFADPLTWAQRGQSVAVDGAGNAGVTWSSYNYAAAMAMQVHATLYRAATGWTQVGTLDDAAGGTSNDSTFPSIGLHTDGTAIAVWRHRDTSGTDRIWATHSLPGSQ
jgi:hypothetical protein